MCSKLNGPHYILYWVYSKDFTAMLWSYHLWSAIDFISTVHEPYCFSCRNVRMEDLKMCCELNGPLFNNNNDDDDDDDDFTGIL